MVDGAVREDLGRVLAVCAVRGEAQAQRDHRVLLRRLRRRRSRLRFAGNHVDLEEEEEEAGYKRNYHYQLRLKTTPTMNANECDARCGVVYLVRK